MVARGEARPERSGRLRLAGWLFQPAEARIGNTPRSAALVARGGLPHRRPGLRSVGCGGASAALRGT